MIGEFPREIYLLIQMTALVRPRPGTMESAQILVLIIYLLYTLEVSIVGRLFFKFGPNIHFCNILNNFVGQKIPMVFIPVGRAQGFFGFCGPKEQFLRQFITLLYLF